jgi:hypothetical protein
VIHLPIPGVRAGGGSAPRMRRPEVCGDKPGREPVAVGEPRYVAQPASTLSMIAYGTTKSLISAIGANWWDAEACPRVLHDRNETSCTPRATRPRSSSADQPDGPSTASARQGCLGPRRRSPARGSRLHSTWRGCVRYSQLNSERRFAGECQRDAACCRRGRKSARAQCDGGLPR